MMRQRSLLILVLIGAVLFSSYFILRYGTYWIEIDTAQNTQVIKSIGTDGSLSHAKFAYPNGITYQALSVFLVQICGIDAAKLQSVVYPLCAGIIVGLTCFVCFRQLTGSAIAGTLATFLLFIQPEFLFTIFRGTHEKITWILVVLALFLLHRQFRMKQSFITVSNTILFYVIVFALVSSNLFLASSFILTLAFALFLGVGLIRLRGIEPLGDVTKAALGRIGYVVLSSMVLWFIFPFYLYLPALSAIKFLGRFSEQIRWVIMGSDTTVNPYAYISTAWVDSRIYLLLSSINWTTLALSAIVWIWMGIGYWKRRPGAVHKRGFFIWLLYAAFSLQIAVATLTDRVWTMASNWQVRLWPVWWITAVVLLSNWVRYNPPRFVPRQRSYIAAVIGVGIAFFATAALLKGTNEPLLGNKWPFFLPAERSAMVWTSDHASKPTAIWAGIDERLRAVAQVHFPPESDVSIAIGMDAKAPYMLRTRITEQRWLRTGTRQDSFETELCIYDNGLSSVFHPRPTTPYQR